MTSSAQESRNNSGDLVQKGKDYIQRGDQCQYEGDFKKATRYYELASKYCPSDAQDRLKDLPLRKASMESKASSSSFSTGWGSGFKKAKESISRMSKRSSSSSHEPTLTGPYFPVHESSSQITLNSQTPSTPQISENIACNIDNAPDTSSLVLSFSNANKDTRDALRSRIQEVIKQFDNSSISFASVQELVVIATIPDKEILLDIINRMLKVLRESPIQPSVVLQGLAVVLNSLPEEIDLSDSHGVYLEILKPISDRLKVIRHEQNEGQLLPLLRALSGLLDAMVCRKVHRLGREDTFMPLISNLNGLSSHHDATVCFLSLYARQALAYIGNDESLVMSIFRRGNLAFAIVGNIKGIVDGDLRQFESVYQNFTELCDFTIQNAWYQGLIYLDCVAGLQDWRRLEMFILKSKLKSDPHFLQGVCLRLEQIVATQTNDDVRYGAIKLLQDLQVNSSELTRHISQGALKRLGIYGGTNHSAAGAIALVISRPVSFILPQVRQFDLPPVWDPLWQSIPNNVLLRAVQDKRSQDANIKDLPSQFQGIGQDIQLSTNDIKKSVNDGFEHSKEFSERIEHNTRLLVENIPVLPTLSDVHTALEAYHKPLLLIQRVSGDTLPLESCYVNLAVVEASDQRQKDKQDLKENAEAFIRLPSYEKISTTDMETSIPLEKLFDKRKLRDGKEDIPKRILIQGRAGIGKTTLCKKLVYEYHNGSWRNHFDAVLWIPLRQLKAFRARDLKGLLREKFFAHSERDSEALAKALEDHKSKVLFILDGLDEILSDTQTADGVALEAFLKYLLQQNHVVITSRPSGVDTTILPKLDLELETIGFSTQNVSDYLPTVLGPEAVKAVQAFIKQTPLIQSLVNIPVQLDVICYSWDSIPSKEKSITMTGLYQTMIRKLWCKDAARLQKVTDGKELTPRQINALRPRQIDQLMAIEKEYLGYLAFKGMENEHQIEFDESTLRDAIDELDQVREMAKLKPLPYQLLDTLKETSFLHTADADPDTGKDNLQRSWFFLHLTFQEYFAASWIAQHLRNKFSKSTNSPISTMTPVQTMEFVQQHKYDPRYEIVWWMVAGQLEDVALSSFFNLLQEAPRDLLGGRHQQLLAACYKEARPQLKDETILTRLGTELMQWLNWEMTLYNEEERNIILGKQSTFPDELLIRCIHQTKQDQMYALNALKERLNLSPSAIEALLSCVHDEDQSTKSLAIEALAKQPDLPHSVIPVMTTALQDESWNVRNSAAKALGTQSALPESSILALITALQDNDSDVRTSAANAIGSQSALPDSIIHSLTTALQDESWNVRNSAALALGTQSALPESSVLALLTALQDNNSDVRKSAVDALGSQSALSDSTIHSFTAALQDGSWIVRYSTAKALGTQTALPESSIQALISALQDEDSDVRVSSVDALCSQSALSDSTIHSLTTALQDQSWAVRNAAAIALGSQSVLPKSSILSLVASLHDEDSHVRSSVTKALEYHSVMPESSIQVLNTALEDEDLVVRISAAKALGDKNALPEFFIQVLNSAIQDSDSKVRISAAEALGTQSVLPEPSILVLTIALQDENWQVKNSAAKALGCQSPLPISSIPALTIALQDQNIEVRSSAAKALNTQAVLPEPSIQALVDALQDKDMDVRISAADSLCSQSLLPKSSINSLTTALQDESWNVRNSAAKALSTLLALPKSSILLLISAFEDESSDVRRSAANALGTKYALPAPFIRSFTTALQDEDCQVRELAAKALGTQSALPESSIQALISALQDEGSGVRASAVDALCSQSVLPESSINSLTTALQDESWKVRNSAAKALDTQSALPESSIHALISASQDEDSDVSASAFNALCSQPALTESSIQALITALQNEDQNIRRSAARTLVSQSVLPESLINALTMALHDEDWIVRDSAAQALGSQSVLPRSSILSLIAATHDKDGVVRRSAAEALESHSEMPESTIPLLIAALGDDDLVVRISAAKALGAKNALPESFIPILNKALQDGDSKVRILAFKALSSQSTFPESSIQAFSVALKDEELEVRRPVSRALSMQPTLPESAILALSFALLDEDRDIKDSASDALAAQPHLSRATIQNVIKALGDERARVYPLYVLNRQYQSLCIEAPGLLASEIETLYKNHLFPYSCKNPVSLYLYDNRLCYFSERGSGKSEILSSEKIEEIVSGFRAVHDSVGISSIPYVLQGV
ncbi:hypothetical protein BGX26_010560 [Mortierella sp. AD094]|nr:hypothetical protein BGX26_010560 [Mortierella sp. AD094]